MKYYLHLVLLLVIGTGFINNGYSQKLYWGEGGNLRSGNTNGTNVRDLVFGNDIMGAAIDTVNNKIYYTDTTDLVINRVNTDGTSQETFLSGKKYRNITVDTDSGYIYYINNTDNTVERALLSDPLPEILANIPATMNDLTIDDSGKFLFITANDGIIRRFDLLNSTLDTLANNLSTPQGIAYYRDSVFWADSVSGFIQKTDTLLGSVPIDLFSVSYAKGVAIDKANDSIYWTVSGSGADRIERGPLDGSSTPVEVISALSLPHYLALDFRVIPPEPDRFRPADDTTNFPINANFNITFNKPVLFDSGKVISIHQAINDSIVQQFTVGGTNVTGEGYRDIYIYTDSLDYLTEYYVTIDSGAFYDYYNDPWHGIQADTTWNFKTQPRIVRTDTSGSWGETSTWLNGEVPLASDSVLIEDSVFIDSGNFESRAVRVDNFKEYAEMPGDGSLTIAGGSLTVGNSIVLDNSYGAGGAMSLTVGNTGQLSVNGGINMLRYNYYPMFLDINSEAVVNIARDLSYIRPGGVSGDTTSREITISGGAQLDVGRDIMLAYLDLEGVAEPIDMEVLDSAQIWTQRYVNQTDWPNRTNTRFFNASKLFLSDELLRMDTQGNNQIYGELRFLDNATLALNGTQFQNLAGHLSSQQEDSIIYNNLTVNNSFDSIPSIKVKRGNQVIVNGTLNLQDGILEATEESQVFLTSGAEVNGGSNESHVDSVLVKSGDTDFTFPIGSNGVYAPIGITNLSEPSVYYGYYIPNFREDTVNRVSPDPLNNFSQIERWVVFDTSQTAAGNIQLYWSNGDSSEISSLSDLRVAGINPQLEETTDYGQQQVTGNIKKGSIISASSFSFPTFESDTAIERVTFGSMSPYENALGGVPAIPTAYKADSITKSSFRANWNNASGAQEYLLDVSKDTFQTYVNNIQDSLVMDTSAVISGLDTAGLYQYRLRSANADSVSNYSDTISVETLPSDATAPDTVIALEAGNITRTSFVARWDSVSSATKYYLDISKDTFNTYISGYQGKVIQGSPVDTVTGLDPGVHYQYRVRAANGLGETSNSEIINVSTRANLTGTVLPGGTKNLTGGNIYLLRVTKSGGYDTTNTKVIRSDGNFSFQPVAGNYILSAKAAPEDSLISTYYDDVITWEKAQEIRLTKDTSGIDITMMPVPDINWTGEGLIQGYVEREISDSTARMLRRRRVQGADVHLRRNTDRNRGLTELAQWVLVATTTTDENGEFNFPNLPDAQYRISVEYPGISMDSTQNIDITINSTDNNENEASISATVTDEGIIVNDNTETGLTEIHRDYRYYPNPADKKLLVDFQDPGNYRLQIITINGKKLLERKVAYGKEKMEINPSQLAGGVYLLRIFKNGQLLDTERLLIK